MEITVFESNSTRFAPRLMIRLDSLVVEVLSKRNVLSEFGHEVNESVVNKLCNRLAVMITAKGKSHLRAEYDSYARCFR